jgi:2-keto-4-pentenoate hydratase
MNENKVREAGDLIWGLWREGKQVPVLPEALRPATRFEGNAIQAQLETHSGAALYGWKIAATSKAGQHHIGVDGPFAGRLLAVGVAADGAELDLDGNHMRVGEPEFAFRMAHDLPPRKTSYKMAEVLDAVATLHPAIEIPDSRLEQFAKVGIAQLIADNACAHQFVLGPAAAEGWRALDLSEHTAVVGITGQKPQEGIGSNVLGDPRAALTWLVNQLSGQGITLKAGQVVTTGTCATPLPIAPGDEMVADFGVLGRVSVRFAPG